MKLSDIGDAEFFIGKMNEALGRCRDRRNFRRSDTRTALYWWSKACRARDGGRCRRCGSADKLRVHHIAEKDQHPDLAFEIGNGITLCELHHLDAHGWNSHQADP